MNATLEPAPRKRPFLADVVAAQVRAMLPLQSKVTALERRAVRARHREKDLSRLSLWFVK